MTDQAPAAPADAGQAPGQGNPPASDANTNKPWYDGLGLKDEDVGYIQNKKWQSPIDVITGYKNLEKFHGVPADQLIKLPKDFNDEKAMGEVYNRLGRPDNPDGYEYKAADGIKLDEGRMKWTSSLSHKLGLNKAQYKALIDATIEYEGGIASEAQKEIERITGEQLEGLKKEWGNAFTEREELGKRAVRAFLPGDADQKSALMESIEGAIGTAAMLKLFANIGEKMGEDKIHSGDGDRPFGYTPQQAKADREQLMSELGDPANKARLDLYNQGKGKDFEKMQQLNRIIVG